MHSSRYNTDGTAVPDCSGQTNNCCVCMLACKLLSSSALHSEVQFLSIFALAAAAAYAVHFCTRCCCCCICCPHGHAKTISPASPQQCLAYVLCFHAAHVVTHMSTAAVSQADWDRCQRTHVLTLVPVGGLGPSQLLQSLLPCGPLPPY